MTVCFQSGMQNWSWMRREGKGEAKNVPPSWEQQPVSILWRIPELLSQLLLRWLIFAVGRDI